MEGVWILEIIYFDLRKRQDAVSSLILGLSPSEAFAFLFLKYV